MRGTKRRVKTCNKRRRVTKRRINKRSRSYKRRHSMKGGWGGATVMDTVLKPFKNDEEEESPMYGGGWGEIPMA